MFLVSLFKARIPAPDGKYTYSHHELPGAGAAEFVFQQEYQNPVFPLVGGPGKIPFMSLAPVQPPQVKQPVNILTYGPGGIPVPDQTLDFYSLDDPNG